MNSLELLRFILPTLAGWLSSEMMSLVDTAVVGRVSAVQLAALGPATMLTDSSVYLFFWINVATTNLFASAVAKNQPNEAFESVSDALWISLACGILLSFGLHFGGVSALRVICTQAPAAVVSSSLYLKIRLLGTPAFMAGTVLQAACLGARDSTSPLLVLLVSGALNLALDLLFVFKLGMGIGGAALATLLSQVVQMLLLCAVVQRRRFRLTGDKSWLLLRRPPTLQRLKSFLAFGGPMFLVLIGKISCYNAMTLAATWGGVVALAAHQVLVSVFFVGCKFGDAVSQTAQAYLPGTLGADAGDSDGPQELTAAARRLASRLVRLSSILGAFVSVAATAFITRRASLFTADASVVAIVCGRSPLLFFSLLAHATTMCTEGLLISTRQLPYLARAYAFNVPFFLSALYFIARRNMGLAAVWKALCAFQFVRLAQFLGKCLQLGMLDFHSASEPTPSADPSSGP